MRQAAYGPAQRNRVILVGGLLPLALTTSGAALLASWAPRLPDEIVVQWSGGNEPSNWAPLPVVIAALLVPLIVAAIAIAATLSLTDDAWPHHGRLIIALGVGASTAVTVALVASVGLQLDHATTGTVEVGRRVLLGVALALPVAALAFLLAPRARPTAAPA